MVWCDGMCMARDCYACLQQPGFSARDDSRKVLEADRPVTVSELPCSEEMQVFAIGPNGKEKGFGGEMRSLMERIRATHPFAAMTAEEILVKSQKTRENVAAERHEKGERFAD